MDNKNKELDDGFDIIEEILILLIITTTLLIIILIGLQELGLINWLH